MESNETESFGTRFARDIDFGRFRFLANEILSFKARLLRGLYIWMFHDSTISLSVRVDSKDIARLWREILSRVYKENARCTASYQISVSAFPFTLSHLCFFLSVCPLPLYRSSPSLDISDSKHNSNPGGLYACRGNSSVATRSSSLIEISYPLTYLSTEPPLPDMLGWRVYPNVQHPKLLPTAPGVRPLHPGRHLSSVCRAYRWVLRKIVYGKNDSFWRLLGGLTHGLTPRNGAYTKQQKYLESCKRSRKSEGKFTERKEVCEVRRYCTYLSAKC